MLTVDDAPGELPEIDGFGDLEPIGQGAFATVYRAIQLDLDRPVAIKVLAITPGVDQRRLQRQFDIERRTLGRLSGVPGVVDVHLTTFTRAGLPAIVMELMEMSLATRLRRDGPVAGQEAIQAGIRLSRALSIAHRRGVFHRDIKPSNILQATDGRVALADFGIAAVQLNAGTPVDAGTGSPEHSAPERLVPTGRPIELGRSDVYSLASTLYQLIVGRAPFGSRHDGGIDALIVRVSSDPVHQFARPDLPPPLMGMLARALAKDPQLRYASAAEFASALESLIPGSISPARAVTLMAPHDPVMSGVSVDSMSDPESTTDPESTSGPNGFLQGGTFPTPLVRQARSHADDACDPLSTISPSEVLSPPLPAIRTAADPIDDEVTIAPTDAPRVGPIVDALRDDDDRHRRHRRRAVVISIVSLAIAAGLAIGVWTRVRSESVIARGPLDIQTSADVDRLAAEQIGPITAALSHDSKGFNLSFAVPTAQAAAAPRVAAAAARITSSAGGSQLVDFDDGNRRIRTEITGLQVIDVGRGAAPFTLADRYCMSVTVVVQTGTDARSDDETTFGKVGSNEVCAMGDGSPAVGG